MHEYPVSIASVTTVVSSYSPEEDGLAFRDIPVSSPRLQNSETLKDLNHFLFHLSDVCANDVRQLIESVPGLFADMPLQMSLLMTSMRVITNRSSSMHIAST